MKCMDLKVHAINLHSYSNKEQKESVLTENDSRSCFQQLLCLRKKQAESSILLELSGREDINSVTSICEKYGTIKSLYTYPGECGNIFLLLEFVDQNSCRNLLLNCQCSNIVDSISICTRLIKFKRKYECRDPKMPVDVIEETTTASDYKPETVSNVIKSIYASEQLSELSIRLRFFFCAVIKDSISGLFPNCDVIPFGSSVNGIGREGCDLDLMIRLNPEQMNPESELFFSSKTYGGGVRILQRKSVNGISEYLAAFIPGIMNYEKILNARIPIFKFEQKILGLKCDISVNNMSAVLMSDILYFCGEIDHRVRPLIHAVKKWAKEGCITAEKPGSYITNFGLSLLVLFFLQNRPAPILPPLKDALCIVGEDLTVNFGLQYLKPLSEWQMKASLNKESLAFLLKEFLVFLGTCDFKEHHISLLTGLARERNDSERKQGNNNSSPIWVQYPVEEDKNVTKNISVYELDDMCEKAWISSKYFSSKMNSKISHPNELSSCLGVKKLKKFGNYDSNKLDVGALFDDRTKVHKKGRHF
ncbi:Poly(A) RNA polymerase, mitochondrial, partial [Stegodyphus mimosarum]